MYGRSLKYKSSCCFCREFSFHAGCTSFCELWVPPSGNKTLISAGLPNLKETKHFQTCLRFVSLISLPDKVYAYDVHIMLSLQHVL